jgi:hypothetical protein
LELAISLGDVLLKDVQLYKPTFRFLLQHMSKSQINRSAFVGYLLDEQPDMLQKTRNRGGVLGKSLDLPLIKKYVEEGAANIGDVISSASCERNSRHVMQWAYQTEGTLKQEVIRWACSVNDMELLESLGIDYLSDLLSRRNAILGFMSGGFVKEAKEVPREGLEGNGLQSYFISMEDCSLEALQSWCFEKPFERGNNLPPWIPSLEHLEFFMDKLAALEQELRDKDGNWIKIPPRKPQQSMWTFTRTVNGQPQTITTNVHPFYHDRFNGEDHGEVEPVKPPDDEFEPLRQKQQKLVGLASTLSFAGVIEACRFWKDEGEFTLIRDLALANHMELAERWFKEWNVEDKEKLEVLKEYATYPDKNEHYLLWKWLDDKVKLLNNKKDAFAFDPPTLVSFSPEGLDFDFQGEYGSK